MGKELIITTANFDEHEEADEETTGYLQKQIEDAEKHNYDTGKPGSLLSRLIAHGNKKTEEEMKRANEPSSSGP